MRRRHLGAASQGGPLFASTADSELLCCADTSSHRRIPTKPVTSLSQRLRVPLALFTALATLPLGSIFHSAQAKPKSGAPAYGYRAKSGSKTQKREDKRIRKQQKDNDKRSRQRNDDRQDDDRQDDDRQDDDRQDDDRRTYRRSSDRGYGRDSNRDNNGRDYVTRYRTVTNSAGQRVRQYYRVYR